MKPSFSSPDGLLQHTQSLRFPPDLESEYKRDYFHKTLGVFRRFYVFVFIIYTTFTLVDYWAFPVTYPSAWKIRSVGCLLIVLTIAFTYSPAYRRVKFFTGALLALLLNISLLVMIGISQPNEPGRIVYPFAFNLSLVVLYSINNHLVYTLLCNGLTLAGLLALGFLRPDLRATPELSTVFVINFLLLLGATTTGVFLGYIIERLNRLSFVQQKIIELERKKSEEVLLNALPATVVERLKRSEVVADYCDSIGVLFADIVDFTPFSARTPPDTVVTWLNVVFSTFDELAEKHGLEKIKTIGDAYMAVSGLPLPRKDYIEALADMALSLQEAASRLAANDEMPLRLRIGLHIGPAMAGVIGKQKFVYDVWGDTINTASRLESSAAPGQIQVSEAVYLALQERYRFDERGIIQVKGKEDMKVYLLQGKA